MSNLDDVSTTESVERTRRGLFSNVLQVAFAGASRLRAMLRVVSRPVRSCQAAANEDLRRAFPEYHRSLCGLLASAGVLLTVAAVFNLALASALLLVVAARAALAAWQGRADYGSAQGLPPGRVGMGAEPLTDPDFFTNAALRYGPIFKSNHFREPMICVVGIRAASELFRTHRDALVAFPDPAYDRFIPGSLLRWKNGEEHLDHRRVFAKALSPHFLRSAEGAIRSSLAAGLATMEAESRTSATGVAPLPHIRSMVLAAWTEVLLGIPATDPAYPELRLLFHDLEVHLPKALPAKRVAGALDRVEELIRTAASSPEAPNLATELEAVRPGSLEDPTSIRNLIYTTVTTHQDVSGLLIWVLKHLSDYPERRQAVRSGALLGTDLADRVTSETIRLEQSEYIYLRAARPISFKDFTIPQGWLVRACVHESHRDATVYIDPDRFNPDRFIGHPYTRDTYAPFGMDHRSCTGEALTRLICRAFVCELLCTYDWDVVSDGQRELSAERHWAPSSRFRISLRQVGGPLAAMPVI